MKLRVADNHLYADNLIFSMAEVVNASPTLSAPVEIRFSHHHGEDRVFAEGLGWVGAAKDDAIVVGRVRGGDGLIPCRVTETRLIGMVERAQDDGRSVRLEVSHG